MELEAVKKSFEQYLQDNNHANEFTLKTTYYTSDGSLGFYIHPTGVDGETFDYKVKDNTLECTSKRASIDAKGE